MKISYNWLSDYVEHGLASADIVDALTMLGLEIEQSQELILSLDGVIVAEVKSVRTHPNADRLQLCDVDLGDGNARQIVCGAPNVAANQRVAVATIGTQLTVNGELLKIRKGTKIRGEISMGMICAENELGLSENHDGIMVLTGQSTIGEPLIEYLSREHQIANDTSFDLSITPNRPDATCHIGVARDLCSLLDAPLTLPKASPPSTKVAVAEKLNVSIECPEICRRYTAMIIEGVTVGPSPIWLKRRLYSVGIRSINNIVDVTNFVMFECGQPLHAFNYDRIHQQKIIVRKSSPQEEFITLDGKTHSLDDGTILICDGQEPIAIGGIMGGKNSEVDDSTKTIVIESAWFDPSSTRRSAKSLGILTEASYRFERGVDTQLQPWAAMRASSLIQELAGGSILNGIIDEHPTVDLPLSIDLRLSRIPKILGTEIPRERIIQIISSLGFDLDETSNGVITCIVPSYRPDILQEIDLIEEIARIHGFENIPLHSSTTLQLPVPLSRPDDQSREIAHSFLTGHGFREIYTNSLLPDEEASTFCHEVLGTDHPSVKTLNAISGSMSTLRPSLLPGMLKVMKHNVHHSQKILRFYEFGHLFHRSTKQATFIENYSEYDGLLIGISGQIQPHGWDTPPRTSDFFDLKGDVGQFLEALQLMSALRFEFHNQPSDITDYHITLFHKNTQVGTIAKLAPSIQDSYDLPDPVFFAELNWTRLVVLYDQVPDQTYTPISLFPVVVRDLALSVDHSQPVGPMVATLYQVGKPLIKDVNVFDVYTGERVPSDQKSIAFSLRFGANRTLRDEEIDRVMEKILNVFSEQFGAILRI